MSREVRAVLWYPRSDTPETVDTARVSLMDVRAANDLVIRYDFDRDGYSIQQPTISEWHEGDDPNNEGLVEVAFVGAWQSGIPRRVPESEEPRSATSESSSCRWMAAPQDGPPPPCGPLEQLCDERCFRCGGTYRGRNT